MRSGCLSLLVRVGAVSAAAMLAALSVALILSFGVSTLGQPEGYVQSRPGLFGEDGEVTSDDTAAFLVAFLDAFESLVDRYAPVPVAA